MPRLRLSRAVTRRPLAALLAASLFALGAATVTGTFASEAADHIVGTRVTGLTVAASKVHIYSLEYTFDITGVDCASMTNAELVVNDRTVQGTTGLPERAALCPQGASSPRFPTKATVSRPVFGDAYATALPSEDVQVWADIRRASPGESPNDLEGTHYGELSEDDAGNPVCVITPTNDCANGTTIYVQPEFSAKMPKRPVWIGIGDGYTSAVNQSPDYDFPAICTLSTPPPAGCVDNADPAISWVANAVDNANALFNPPEDWKIQYGVDEDGDEIPERYLNFASADTTATELGDNGNGAATPVHSQLASLFTELRERAPDAEAGQPGSWNWVGLTGGLVDAGVMNALNNWYGGTGHSPASASTTDPWSVPSGSDPATACPVLTSVPGQLIATPADGDTPAVLTPAGAAMRAGLEHVVDVAKAADPNVRVVHLQYPYWAEDTNGGNYTNPCWPSVRDAVDAINTAVGLKGVPDVVEVDLRLGFGARPTGDRAIDGVRDGSLIQLSKPYGFPYPTPGSSRIGLLVKAAITPKKPIILHEFSRGADVFYDGTPWYNDQLLIDWFGIDFENATSTPLPQPPADPDPTEVVQEGQLTFQSPPFCKTLPDDAGLSCADDHHAVVWTDFTAPPVEHEIVGAVGADGWYRAGPDGSLPKVVWRFMPGVNGAAWADPPGPAWDSDLDASGVTSGADAATTDPMDPDDIDGPDDVLGADDFLGSVTVPLLAETSGSDLDIPAGFLCDHAENCAADPVHVKVDLTKPVRLGTTYNGSSTLPAWFKTSTVNIIRTWKDDVSGLADPAQTTVTDSVAGEGTHDVPVSVADVAGNVATNTATVRIDTKAPSQLKLFVNGQEITAPAQALVTGGNLLVTCWAADAGEPGDVSGVADNNCRTDFVSNVAGVITYDVTATDAAGNTGTKRFTFVAPAGEVTYVKPDVDGGPASAANANDWYNAPITFNWQGVKGNPGRPLNPLSGPTPTFWSCNSSASSCTGSTQVSTDGTGIVVNRPHIRDIGVPPLESDTEPATFVVNLDQVKPIIGTFGIVDGETYDRSNAPALPGEDCTLAAGVSDDRSGIDTCAVVIEGTPLPSTGLPGTVFTLVATATDKAGNVQTKTITWTAYDVTPSNDGRMTGGGSYNSASVPQPGPGYGTVKTDFTLRCNGSPNKLAVSWSGGSFDLDQVTKVLCWDDPNVDPQRPDAPIDTFYGTGTGIYCRNGDFVGHDGYHQTDDESDHDGGDDDYRWSRDRDDDRRGRSGGKYRSATYGSGNQSSTWYGNSNSSRHDDRQYSFRNHTGSNQDADGNRCRDRYTGQTSSCVAATIEWKYVDAGEPGTGDTLTITIKDNNGVVVLQTSGTIIDGNFQAHESQGNGTNNNGNVNGPNGHNPSTTTTTAAPTTTTAAPTTTTAAPTTTSTTAAPVTNAGATTGGSNGRGTARITVEATCRTVTVTSSKDISHVVVYFADGTSKKFEGLRGSTWSKTFAGLVRSATAKSATTQVTDVADSCAAATSTAATTTTIKKTYDDHDDDDDRNGKSKKSKKKG